MTDRECLINILESRSRSDMTLIIDKSLIIFMPNLAVQHTIY